MNQRVLRLTILIVFTALALSIAQAEERPAEDVMMRAISGDAPAPEGRHVDYFEANEDTRGYLAMPEGEGPFPTVILIHEWNGLVDRIRQTADAFAEHGYIAFAADLYSGRTGSNREENIELMREARSDEQAIIDNLDAAVDWLKTNTPTTGRIATVGWCFGGGVALSYALGSQKHDGTAIFYGSLLDDPEQMRHIHHEVYGTFAEEDTGIPVDEVEAFVTAMRAAGIDNDVHIYDAVDHGFWLYTERDSRDARPAGAHAWERLRAYLDRTIGPESTETEEE
ncbi:MULTISPECIES: dienelactone hydrolase family protein [unclassified Wenzhouxiangella]|uniref:dienelactone hydrolase family protein n=1 Tax=unclassified Wenzhouxiangella TaxID=2613841 RepID=UPI000E32CBD3|nr:MULTISPECIES: dienelactone hydrolase family protein [unclassified Wenzhouxiangella]RFF27127.1 dienelactone hydrolase family protein [Wenzhouxiangella sp. 15181]RFP69187.1 dienelactone hydrolase family protein [Wenzhouxiangella sp. 15190]